MWEWIQAYIINATTILDKVGYSLLMLVVVMVLKRWTQKMIKNMGDDQGKYYKYRKVCSGIYWLLYLVCLLIIWYKSSTAIFTFLGFFSAGLAIAIKDVVLNMIGGFYILCTKPFKVGERIEIAGQVGDVIDISLFQFTMLEVGNRIIQEQSTGRILHMPNSLIFSAPLANYEKGFKYIWHEMNIKLALNSDWETAKLIFNEIIEKHSNACIEAAEAQIKTANKQYMICYNNLTPIIYTEVKEGAIWLSMRYLCEPRQIRVTENLIWEEILKCTEQNERITIL